MFLIALNCLRVGFRYLKLCYAIGLALKEDRIPN